MDHGDAGIDGVTWRVELDGLAEQRDLAAVRTVEAGEDVRQGRLARAVLAQERVDLAGSGLEVDVLVRDDRGKALGDSAERDCRRRWGGLRLPTGR